MSSSGKTSITAAKVTVIPANEGHVPNEGYKRWRRNSCGLKKSRKEVGAERGALAYTHQHV